MICPNCGKDGDHRGDGLFVKGFLCTGEDGPRPAVVSHLSGEIGKTVQRVMASMEQLSEMAGTDVDLSELKRLSSDAFRTAIAAAEAAGTKQCVNCGDEGEPGHHFMEDLGIFVCSGTALPCPFEPHDRGLVYNVEKDVLVCPACGHEQYEEMGG